jgi:hypothetical protein
MAPGSQADHASLRIEDENPRKVRDATAPDCLERERSVVRAAHRGRSNSTALVHFNSLSIALLTFQISTAGTHMPVLPV